MGLFLKQDDNRSELQSRLAAELLERSKKKAQLMDDFDGVNDSQYIKGSKKTTSLAPVWVFLIAVALAISIWLIFLSLE